MTLPIHQSTVPGLSMLQTTWSNQLNPVINNPLMSGLYLKGVSLSAGSNPIPHKLGRAYQGWINCGVQPQNPSTIGAWQTWTPTSYTCSGSMTFTSVIAFISTYQIINGICFMQGSFNGTTGGTASTTIYINGLPAVPATEIDLQDYICRTQNNGTTQASDLRVSVTNNRLQIGNGFSGSNFALASGTNVEFDIFYKINPAQSGGAINVWEGVSTDSTKFINLYSTGTTTANIYVF